MACGGRAADTVPAGGMTATSTTSDPADPSSWRYICAPEIGRIVAPGMSFGEPDGCNQCTCDADELDGTCANGVCRGLSCTAAACTSPRVGAGPTFPVCQSDADCGAVGRCLFDAGCTNPLGRCIGVQLNPTMATATKFCSCQGITVDGNAPTEPYAYAGACR